MRRILALMLSLCMLAMLVAGCSTNKAATGAGAAVSAGSGITVKVLDVGQGDAILIRSGSTVTLVDTGDVLHSKNNADKDIVKLLQQENVREIDNVIITHPHADHLGGMAAVMKNFTIKHIYDSGQTTTSSVYRKYLAAAKKQNIPFEVVKPGQEIQIGEAKLVVLAPLPNSGAEQDLNNGSIVMQLQYGKFTLLLTGDAEQPEESQLLAKYGAALKSMVLKSGHHGSHTSSSQEFLQAVRPEAAVISAGLKNDYHHPHPSTLKRYQDMGINIYRTDKDGTVTIRSDGNSYEITKER